MNCVLKMLINFCLNLKMLPSVLIDISGHPGGSSGKESTCQCRRCKGLGFNPWLGKIPCRRAWQPTPVFLPGESAWTEESGRLQSMGLQRVGHDWRDLACTHTWTLTGSILSRPKVTPRPVTLVGQQPTTTMALTALCPVPGLWCHCSQPTAQPLSCCVRHCFCSPTRPPPWRSSCPALWPVPLRPGYTWI